MALRPIHLVLGGGALLTLLVLAGSSNAPAVLGDDAKAGDVVLVPLAAVRGLGSNLPSDARLLLKVKSGTRESVTGDVVGYVLADGKESALPPVDGLTAPRSAVLEIRKSEQQALMAGHPRYAYPVIGQNVERAWVREDATKLLGHPDNVTYVGFGTLPQTNRYLRVRGAQLWPPHAMVGETMRTTPASYTGSRIIPPGAQVNILAGPVLERGWLGGNFYRVSYIGESATNEYHLRYFPSENNEGWIAEDDLTFTAPARDVTQTPFGPPAADPVYTTNVPGPPLKAGRVRPGAPYVPPTDAAGLFASWQRAIQGGKLPQIAINALYRKYSAAATREGRVPVDPTYRGPFPGGA